MRGVFRDLTLALNLDFVEREKQSEGRRRWAIMVEIFVLCVAFTIFV